MRPLFTGEVLTPGRQGDVTVLSLRELFGHFPVALLIGTETAVSP
jgi:hypothetical protein